MEELQEKIKVALSTVFDPEIPVNILELGFIYNIEIKENKDVNILMTLTAPNCPVAESLPVEVQQQVANVEGVGNVTVNVTFDPPWSMDRISDAAKLELGLL